MNDGTLYRQLGKMYGVKRREFISVKNECYQIACALCNSLVKYLGIDPNDENNLVRLLAHNDDYEVNGNRTYFSKDCVLMREDGYFGFKIVILLYFDGVINQHPVEMLALQVKCKIQDDKKIINLYEIEDKDIVVNSSEYMEVCTKAVEAIQGIYDQKNLLFNEKTHTKRSVK